MAMAPPSPVQAEPQPGNKQFSNHLAAAVRSINWSYAIFWSVSSTGPAGVLTWKDGFYNGEVKTRKVTNSMSQLTTDQLALQRSEQLRELYESLQLPGSDSRHRPRPPRPVAALSSPEDLGDTEWFYVICMTYAFRPGEGLPGKSLARNEQVWLRNPHLADSKTTPRAILAKSSSIRTIVCIPLMDGVLELGTTDSVLEDPDLVNRATAPFRELQFPASTKEPSSSPSADDDTEEEAAAADTIVFDEIDHTDTAMELAIVSEGQELSKLFTECLPNANLEEITMEIDELYSICEGLDVQPLDDDWIAMDGLLNLSPSTDQPDTEAATANDAEYTLSIPADGSPSPFTSFKAWTRPESDGAVVATLAIIAGEAQKILKKVVAGGRALAESNGDGDGSTTTRTMMIRENGVRNHVISERRRREKLNEMFLILKSLIPSTCKVDKASILAETIAYLKELEQKVQDLESSKDDLITATRPAAGRHAVDEVVGTKKVVSGGVAKRKKGSELDAGDDRQRSNKDCPSNISITVAGKEVHLDVQCRWKERLVARVFDAVKSLHLNVLSVQSSTLNGLLGLKFASSAAVAPGMITEALQKAISGKP